MIFYTANLDEPFYPAAALSDMAGQPVRVLGDEQGFWVVDSAGSDKNAWASYSSNPQPSRDAVASWRPPTPEPPPPGNLTDVEIAAERMAARRQAREDVIFSDKSGLVGKCYAWLQRSCVVPGESEPTNMTPGAALVAGQGLCSTYGNQLRHWIDFAAPDFFASMSNPDGDRPWLEWVPEGVGKSIREAILDAIYFATYGVPRQ